MSDRKIEEAFARPKARSATLTKIRNLKMSRSAHAYVRGNTVKFYEWLDGLKSGTLPNGPPVWICGDCHVGNLGPVANAHGEIEIQIRDLDQTVIGNPAHDLIRLGLSPSRCQCALFWLMVPCGTPCLGLVVGTIAGVTVGVITGLTDADGFLSQVSNCALSAGLPANAASGLAT